MSIRLALLLSTALLATPAFAQQEGDQPVPEQGPPVEPLMEDTPAGEPAAEAPENDSWDVATPRGPGELVSLDVTEGTWMSLDVHPSGEKTGCMSHW